MSRKCFLTIIVFFVFASFILPQSIIVTNPAEDEVVNKGSAYTIKWTKTGTMVGTVKIRLFNSTGVKIKDITNSTTNDGIFTTIATVFDNVTPGNYLIRVKTTDDAVWDDSGVFILKDPTIIEPSITVTSPEEDDNWQKGTEYTIEWDKSGTMGSNVKITLHKYITGSGVSSSITQTIAVSTPNDRRYSWTIPSAIPEASYSIRVKTTDNQVSGDSEIFLISNPPPTTEQPTIPGFSAPPKTAYTATKVPNRSKYTQVSLKKPDLKLTLDYDPKISWVGNKTKAKFTVTNIGTKVSKATLLRVSYMGKTKFTDEFHVTNLKPFEKFVKTINWIPLQYGYTWWEGIVDRKNKMGDSKRQNNSVSKRILINASDLIVCVTTGRRIKRNVKISINITVKNIGKTPSTICRLRIKIDEKKKKGYIIPALAPGETFVVTRKHKWKNKGKKYIFAWADYKHEVHEYNEHNNDVDGIVYVVGILDDKTDSPEIVCSDDT